MSPITTHVLDTSQGKPAENVQVRLEKQENPQNWITLAQKKTNHDGRIPDLLPPEHNLQPGTYRLTFETGHYFQQQNLNTLYPYVCVVFQLNSNQEHYHIPLLISPFSYSTYRGS